MVMTAILILTLPQFYSLRLKNSVGNCQKRLGQIFFTGRR
jgi:hypothetical protein